MTIAVVAGQQVGNTSQNNTTVSKAYTSNVTNGSLLIILYWSWHPAGASDPVVVGDCTKSAGTATLGTITLDASTNSNYTGTNYITTAIFSVPVTGTGSCTIQVAGAPSGSYNGIALMEVTGADTGATRVEANPTASGGASATADTGNGTSAAGALFVGVSNWPAPSALTLTEDAAFTKIFEDEDFNNEPGNAAYKIVTSGNTDSYTCTASISTSKWTNSLVVYKAAAGAGSPSSSVSPSVSPSASLSPSASVSPSSSVSPSPSTSLSPSSSVSPSASISPSASVSPSSSISPSSSGSASVSPSHSVSPSSSASLSPSPSSSVSPSASVSPSSSASPSSSVSPSPSVAPAPDIVWGQVTGVAEGTIHTFAVNWTGTGNISGSGNLEKVTLDTGQYEIGEVVNTGAVTTTLTYNQYASGDTVVVYYRHGTTINNCLAASWQIYTAPFTSLGYVQVKIQPTDEPLAASANGRYLVDQAGNPVLMIGEAAWSGIGQLTQAEMNTYLSDRAARGFNAILVNLLEHQFSDNAPNNANNVSPWTGANFTTPNSTYFNYVDYFIQRAEQLGLTVLLAPIYLGAAGTGEGWDTEVAAASSANMQSWGEYVGARYTNYDNIIWVIGGDQNATTLLSKINSFVTGLQNFDTRHLITFHDARGTIGSDNLSGATWYTLSTIYTTYLGTPAKADTAYAVSPTLPFFQIEAYYENEHSMTAQNLRAQAYWTILRGGTGHVFGNNPIWKFAFDGVTSDWVNALDDAGSVSMTYVGQLFNAVAWYSLAPDSSHVVLTSGYGTLGNDDFAPCGYLASSLAVIYMPSNRTMAVDMTKFSGTVTARWYDPTNGTYTADAASPLSNSGSHNFSRATTNSAGAADWCLVLTV